jgi:guanyl-specific ribonuclease Sa
MKKIWKVLLPLLLLALLLYLRLPAQTAENPTGQQPQTQNTEVLTLAPESAPEQAAGPEEAAPSGAAAIAEDGEYNAKDDVALYIHTYGHLPSNYISKKQAEALGWTGGSLEPYAPGKSLGGTYFGNYEGQLPDAKGRKWTECDVNNQGKKSRGPERLVYSNDGLIYYTPDHYESFVLLYGEE